jgi:hypothetical protein
VVKPVQSKPKMKLILNFMKIHSVVLELLHTYRQIDKVILNALHRDAKTPKKKQTFSYNFVPGNFITYSESKFNEG